MGSPLGSHHNLVLQLLKPIPDKEGTQTSTPVFGRTEIDVPDYRPAPETSIGSELHGCLSLGITLPAINSMKRIILSWGVV